MIWFFAYGSLMWRPGFDHRERRPALLRGYQRAFCRLSFRHRGTPDAPGMVLGLAPGGACRGIAYGVAPGQAEQALAYLDEREGAGYRRMQLPLQLEGGAQAELTDAWVYLPEPSHPTYAPGLPERRIVELLATGVGMSGTATDYLRELLEALARLGVQEPGLRAILNKVERYRAQQTGCTNFLPPKNNRTLT